MNNELFVIDFILASRDLEEVIEHFKRAFCEMYENLIDFSKEFDEIWNEVFILSPKEYGISLIRTKVKEKCHDTYRCLQKVLKNLPYHRRDYRVLVSKREEFDTCEDEE